MRASAVRRDGDGRRYGRLGRVRAPGRRGPERRVGAHHPRSLAATQHHQHHYLPTIPAPPLRPTRPHPPFARRRRSALTQHSARSHTAIPGLGGLCATHLHPTVKLTHTTLRTPTHSGPAHIQRHIHTHTRLAVRRGFSHRHRPCPRPRRRRRRQHSWSGIAPEPRPRPRPFAGPGRLLDADPGSCAIS